MCLLFWSCFLKAATPAFSAQSCLSGMGPPMFTTFKDPRATASILIGNIVFLVVSLLPSMTVGVVHSSFPLPHYPGFIAYFTLLTNTINTEKLTFCVYLPLEFKKVN